MANIFSYKGCHVWRRWLASLPLIFAILLYSLSASAHPAPGSQLFLDISPQRVALEMRMPVTELELAFGYNISKDPEAIPQKYGKELGKYLRAHIMAYASKNNPWLVTVDHLEMDKGRYADSNIPYWEVVAHVLLRPQEKESTRKFFLFNDVIMHEVINHMMLVTIRSDWESSSGASAIQQVMVIQNSMQDMKVHPLEINLQRGSRWNGCRNMISLGMCHIKEGTDHLLFLLVLLLPAILVRGKNGWGSFGGIRHSLMHLLRITAAFTIGHSLTLLAGATGWLRLPQQPVEIMIAFSILVSALHAVRPLFPGKEAWIAALFGLVHGLAFATVLSEMNLDAGTLLISILGFNLGIEIMQLFIVALIIPWLILLGKTHFYKWFRIIIALAAAVASMAWITERSTGNGNLITRVMEKLSVYGWWCIAGFAFFTILTFSWYSSIKTANKSTGPPLSA